MFGQLFGPLGQLFNVVFTYPIFNVLVVFFRLFGDFGLSIVVLTLVIKLILFPLTLKQLRSMKSTQALQPQIAEIKKKYAKDQQAQMMATQALYKEYGINPASGCLPLIPQMFVLYGLYAALDIPFRATLGKHETLLQHINSAIYPFIPHFATLPNLNLTWLGFISHSLVFPLGQADPTHILPILAGLATFVQLRMSQPATAPGSSTAGDPTQQTMKTMQYIMPLFTVFIGWTFPSGLALYWTVSSIFQAIQQYFVTGWGNLLVLPGVAAAANKPSATSQRDFSKERQEGGSTIRLFGRDITMPPTPDSGNGSSKGVVEGSISPSKNDGKSDGPVESKMRAVPAGSGSRSNGNGSNGNGSNGANAARRRASGGSASARRRSNGSGSSSQKRSSSRR